MDLIDTLAEKNFISKEINDECIKQFRIAQQPSTEETNLIKASILEKVQEKFCEWHISVKEDKYNIRIEMINYKPILNAILQNSTYAQMRNEIRKQSWNTHIKGCDAYRGDDARVQIIISYNEKGYGEALYQVLKQYINDIEYQEPYYSSGSRDGAIRIKTQTGEQAERERRNKRINELKAIFEEI